MNAEIYKDEGYKLMGALLQLGSVILLLVRVRV